MPITERLPAVAGRFYPGEARSLADEVARHLGAGSVAAAPAQAVVVPHAGYVYSGAIAGETYARVCVPSRVVVLNPNHTGRGARRSLWRRGSWVLPTGSIPIATELAAILEVEAGLEDDTLAHLHEHSGEVQLPFLQARRADVSVVPICLSALSLAECREVGRGLARGIFRSGFAPRDVLLVASTDMSHFLSATESQRLDTQALERLLALDPDGLYEVVTRHRISMCGYVPTTVALIAALELGATTATLVRYGHSGETSGDLSRVVGYAGAIIS